jgi:hypothetical protein
MFRSIRSFWWVVLGALCFVPGAFGQQVNITFTGGYSSDTYLNTLGEDVATGLYTANVNGQNTYIVCDDLYDSVSNNQKWTANVITLANSATGTLFGSAIGQQGYVDMAYLANYMFTNQGSLTGSQFTGISLALWNITSGGLTSSLIGGGSSVWDATAFAKTLTSAQLSALNWAMNLILSNSPQLSQLNGTLYIYTPVGAKYQGEPQEMFGWVPGIQMPEGGSAALYLLLAGASCFGAMFFRQRRQAIGVRPDVA